VRIYDCSAEIENLFHLLEYVHGQFVPLLEGMKQMRNPSRIPKNWAKIARFHSEYPDWRMGQFLMNLLNEFKEDPFFLEDDEFIEKVEEVIKSWKKS